MDPADDRKCNSWLILYLKNGKRALHLFNVNDAVVTAGPNKQIYSIIE